MRAETEEEVMRLVGDHARTLHKMTNVTPDVAAKIKGAIKSVTVNV